MTHVQVNAVGRSPAPISPFCNKGAPGTDPVEIQGSWKSQLRLPSYHSENIPSLEAVVKVGWKETIVSLREWLGPSFWVWKSGDSGMRLIRCVHVG